MLLAFGAASAALDAIKSLTSKPSSSQPIGSGSTDPFDVSAAPSGDSTAVTGFSGAATQISPTTLSALLDAQSQASQNATTSIADSDGSTTTSLTYADGKKVTTTSPAPTTSSSAATSSYNLAEQLIQREAGAISFSAPTLSVNV